MFQAGADSVGLFLWGSMTASKPSDNGFGIGGGATRMLVDATADMLRRHSPFDRMDQKALAFLSESAKISAASRRIAIS